MKQVISYYNWLQKRLGGVISADKVLARFGGDEFIIVIPQLFAITEAFDLAEEIIKVMKDPFFI
jgi:GGDEF domain-containing protein